MNTLTFKPDMLVQHLKAALRFVGKDETRVHLNSLCFDGDRIVSTDGHRMWLATHLQPDFRGSFLLRRDDVVKLCKAVDVKSHFPAEVTMTLDERTLTVVQAGATLTFRTVDATFPPYQQVLPTIVSQTAERAYPAMNTTYLADAAGAFADLGGKKKRRYRCADHSRRKGPRSDPGDLGRLSAGRHGPHADASAR